jgi:hypothetical protein
MTVSDDQWGLLRALKTGDPPHSQRALAYATGLEEPALGHALEALANTVPPLATSDVDVRVGERLWAATSTGHDALDAAEPARGRPLKPLPPF